MPVTECMKQTTNRQYKVWLAWLSDEELKTGINEMYSAQVALEIRRLLHFHLKQDISNLKLDSFFLKPKKETPDITIPAAQKRQQALEWAKAKWLAFVNYGKK